MKHLGYIPINTTSHRDNSRTDRSDLMAVIEDIVNDVLNGSTDPIKGVFVQRVCALLGKELTDEQPISHMDLSGEEGDLIKIYTTCGIANTSAIDAHLHTRWLSAVNDRDSTVFKGEGSLYEVYQNIHGDVTLSQMGMDSQGELFDKKWREIVDYPIEAIRAYQETTTLACVLLVAYMRGQGDIDRLSSALQSLRGASVRGCNAADAGTKDDLYQFEYYFDRVDDQIQVGPSIFGGNGVYSAGEYHSDKRALIIGKYSGPPNRRFSQSIVIPVDDIPAILSALCVFSGRSGNGVKNLIERYIQKYGENN